MLSPLRNELADQRQQELRRVAERARTAPERSPTRLAAAAAITLRRLADRLEGACAPDPAHGRAVVRQP